MSIYIGEKAMAPHSSTLAWKIPWTEEPGRLQSMGSLRVGHDWATSFSLFTFMHWRRKWQPTPGSLPGESQGQGSLVGCRLWGRTESDTTEATQQQQQQYIHNVVHSQCCTFTMLYIHNVVPSQCCIFTMLYIHNVVYSQCCTFTMLYIHNVVHSHNRVTITTIKCQYIFITPKKKPFTNQQSLHILPPQPLKPQIYSLSLQMYLF